MNNRHTTRLQNYDYTQAGAYFVTICTYQRVCLFGDIQDGMVQLSDVGNIVAEEWLQTAILRPNVGIDAFVVMPNHFHGILVIVDAGMDHQDITNQGMAHSGIGQDAVQPGMVQGMIHHAPTETVAKRQFAAPIAGSLSTIVAAFKAAVTRRVHRLPHMDKILLWQRNFYEHIIRNEADLQRLQAYIEINPSRWNEDSLYSPHTKA